MPNLHNRYNTAERNISQENPEYMLNYSFPCSCSKNLSSCRFIIKQQWTIKEISIFSNSSHLERRAGLSNTIQRGTHPGTIPARFGLIWFRGFRGEDVTSLCLHSVVFSSGGHLGWGPMSSDTILKGDHIRTIPPRFGPDWPSSFRREDFLIHFLLNFLFLVTAAILVGSQGRRTQL